jgi:hypothetical protein
VAVDEVLASLIELVTMVLGGAALLAGPFSMTFAHTFGVAFALRSLSRIVRLSTLPIITYSNDHCRQDMA